MKIIPVVSATLSRVLAAGGLLVLVFAGSPLQAADALAQLQHFVRSTHSAEGAFEQTVHAAAGSSARTSAGRFAFARPGRFHWLYEQPYRQELIGDGERLWSWDPDLNQVVVRTLGDALGATPAAILFGQGELEQSFALNDDGEEGGLSWVLAIPRQNDSGFERVRIGLEEGELRQMELRDSFGQTTLIRFVQLDANPALPATRFQFSPPPGADVIGDLPSP